MASKGTLRIRVLGDTGPIEKTISGLGGVLKGGLIAAGTAAAVGLFQGFQGALERSNIEGEIKGRLRLTEGAAEEAGEAVSSLFASGISSNMGEIGSAVEAVMGTFDGFENASDSAIEAASEDALNYAQAFETDVGSAVGTAQKLLEEDLVGSAEEAFDVLIAGSSEVTPALRDELADATNEYSGYFSDLGITAEEMFTLFADADSQFELDKTGDAIKELQIRATDMSTKSVEAFEEAGLEADEMAAMILEGGDTAREGFDKIIEGLLSIEDPVDQSNAAIALFGTPLEDMSVEEIPEFLESLASMEGGLDNVAGASEGLAEDLDTPARKFQGFKQTIKTVLTDAMEPFLDWFADNEDTVRQWFDRGVEGVVNFASRLSSWWTEDVQPVLSALADEIGAWWEESGRPALDGFLAWVEDNWPTVQEAWGNLTEWIGDTADKITEFWEDHAKPAIDAWLVAIEENWPKFEEAFGRLQTIIDDLAEGISTLASRWAGKSSDMADDTAESERSISDNIGLIMDSVNALLAGVEVAARNFEGAWYLMTGVVTRDSQSIAAGVDLLTDGAFTRFGEKVREVIDSIIDWFDDLVTTVEGLPGRISSAASGMFSGITEDFRSSINTVIAGWNNLSFSLGSKTFDFGPLGSYTFQGASIHTPNIPYLAEGAVLAANRPMLAVVGDNKTSREIVAPEDMLRRVVREESGGSGVEVHLYNPAPEPTSKMVEDAMRVGQLMAVGSA